MAVYFPNVPLSSTPGDALLNAGVLLDAGPRYYSDPQQLRMPLGSGVYGWLQDDIDAISVQAQAPAAPTATSAGPDAGGVVLPEFPDVVSALDLSPLNNALYELSTALQEQREVAQLGDLSGTLDQLNVIVNDRGATTGQRVVVLQQALQTGTPLGAGGGGGGIGGGFGVSSAHNLLGWPHIDTVAVALAAGDMIYRSATDWVVLAAGVNHQLLEFNGPGSAPAWTSGICVTTLEATSDAKIGGAGSNVGFFGSGGAIQQTTAIMHPIGSDWAAGNPPTDLEFNALRQDVLYLHATLMGIIGHAGAHGWAWRYNLTLVS